MIAPASRLVLLLLLVGRIPVPAPERRRRGHPPQYSDRLFLKALVVMVIRHLHRPGELLAVLHEPTAEMRHVRALLLSEGGRWPCRRPGERRLARLPTCLPAQIGCLGRCLVEQLQPWADCGRAVAVAATVRHARGGVWHAKHRGAGVGHHTSGDTEATWTNSGWHGWVYGGKLHLVSTVASVWIPLAAELTPANTADTEVAVSLLADLPAAVRCVLGERHDNAPNVRAVCAGHERLRVTAQYGAYPHADDGVDVRRVFHTLRSANVATFNELFKGTFDVPGSVPTQGLRATRRFALGALFVCHLMLLARFEAGKPLRTGLKAFLKAA